MSGLTTTSSTTIPVPSLRRWLLSVPLFLLVAYLVLMDNGAISQTGTFLHELMHDGRHLLGVPCH